MLKLFVTILICFQLAWTSHERGQNISRDFRLFVRILAGHYDNIKQYEQDIDRGLPPTQRHIRYTTQLNREVVPLFPRRRHYYIEQYNNGNSSDVARQSLYSIGIDRRSRDVIQMKVYAFVDPGKFLHARTYSRLFRDLRPEDLVYRTGCDVTWTRRSRWPPRFESKMGDGCFIENQGMKVRIDDTNNVTLSALTSFEKWYAPNGTEILGVPSPYVMLRQREPEVSANPEMVDKTAHESANHPLLYKSWLN